jgi:hypothetical protein
MNVLNFDDYISLYGEDNYLNNYPKENIFFVCIDEDDAHIYENLFQNKYLLVTMNFSQSWNIIIKDIDNEYYMSLFGSYESCITYFNLLQTSAPVSVDIIEQFGFMKILS